MRVAIEVEDLLTLLAAAKVMRAALTEAGADPEALDTAVANIAKTVSEPEGGMFPPNLISDN